MAKSAMPKSKAKTAYGLLSEIRKLILEEPKRYNQGDYLSTGEHAAETYATSEMPSCGTVGCVAGWVCALKGGAHLRHDDVLEHADKVLGLTTAGVDYWNLFGAEKAGVRWAPSGGVTDASLRRHAERGAAHIERFQKKYAAQLKAKRV